MRADDVAHLRKSSDTRVVEEARPTEEVDRDEEVPYPAGSAESITDLLRTRAAVVERQDQRPLSTWSPSSVHVQDAFRPGSRSSDRIQMRVEEIPVELVPCRPFAREPGWVGRPRVDYVVVHQRNDAWHVSTLL